MTASYTIASFHSVERTKERAGLNDKAAERQIARAMKNGKCAEAFTSWERNYLENEAHDDCFAVAYAGYCYIVNADGFCVTMYALPSWFGKKKRFDGKERIRNPKTYSKLHFNSYDFCEC